MKKICTSLRDHATNEMQLILNKKMLPLINKELKLHQDASERYICGKEFIKKFANDKKLSKS